VVSACRSVTLQRGASYSTEGKITARLSVLAYNSHEMVTLLPWGPWTVSSSKRPIHARLTEPRLSGDPRHRCPRDSQLTDPLDFLRHQSRLAAKPDAALLRLGDAITRQSMRKAAITLGSIASNMMGR
jgi:hypothetical protein